MIRQCARCNHLLGGSVRRMLGVAFAILPASDRQ